MQYLAVEEDRIFSGRILYGVPVTKHPAMTPLQDMSNRGGQEDDSCESFIKQV